MIHRTGSTHEKTPIVWDYEWFEYCNPPDHNPKLSKKVRKAQEQAWHACNAAAIKYKAAFTTDQQTPEWIHSAAAEKGVSDILDIEYNTGKSQNPSYTEFKSQTLYDSSASDEAAAAKQKMIQIAIVAGVSAIALFLAFKSRN